MIRKRAELDMMVSLINKDVSCLRKQFLNFYVFIKIHDCSLRRLIKYQADKIEIDQNPAQQFFFPGGVILFSC